MANSMVKIDIHLIFHIKSTSIQMHYGDLPRIFAYIGGILNGYGSIPIIVGGISDHIHFDYASQKYDFSWTSKKHKVK